MLHPDLFALTRNDLEVADIEVLKARLVERDATIAKLEAELAPFRARDGARRARMARSADDE